MDLNKIYELVAQMTLEEKAGLTSGKDAWFTKSVERLEIPSMHMTDGPHGLRSVQGDQNALDGTAAKAVSFPAECAMAASFDRDLIREIGSELGKEAQAYHVDLLLGPGVNMKRSPLCGRNFEYFSEDPYLAGELGAAYVKGVQGEGVGTSLKHFFANNQEHRRNDSSSEMDERTMREIYLAAFEKVIKEAQPLTVMASYNKVDNVFSTENRMALDGILRGEWGFEGAVVSDWGATHDRAAAIAAGTDLTMPFDGTDEDLVEAVKDGRVSEEALDACCVRLLSAVFRAVGGRREETFDEARAEQVALNAARESAVLLKNEDGLLPLDRNNRVAVIGLFAERPRFQGGGSSNINVTRTCPALDAIREKGAEVLYACGYRADGETDDALLTEAVEAARSADAAVIFAGLHDSMETEGADRVHMRMSEGHNLLIDAVCEANPNTAVVLHNGSPVEMPWIGLPKAVLEVYLGGQMVGQAAADVLFGDANPSGHLAETFPVKLSDNPSFLSFGGEGNRVRYQEGVFIGYRYYETKQMRTLFPFGYGLSYTDFEYSDLKLSSDRINENDGLKATVTVTNTGDRAGKAVVQLYVAPHHVDIIRPVRELKGFAKIELQPGESREVELTLDRRSFAHWNMNYHDWKVEGGEYDIQIGLNARDIVLSKTVRVDARMLLPAGGFTEGVPMTLLMETAKGKQFLSENIIHMIRGMVRMGFVPEQLLQALENMPGGPSLEALEMISRMSGGNQGAGGREGLDALFAQPVQILMMFLPKEKIVELRALLEELNREYN